MLTTTQERRTARVRADIPLFIHREYLVKSLRTGELANLHLIWTTRKRWERWLDRRGLSAASWNVIFGGPFVISWKIDF